MSWDNDKQDQGGDVWQPDRVVQELEAVGNFEAAQWRTTAMENHRRLREQAEKNDMLQEELRTARQENERLRMLLGALVEDGPFQDSETGECLTCANRPYDKRGKYTGKIIHAPNCSWWVAQQALEQPRPAPTSGTKSD